MKDNTSTTLWLLAGLLLILLAGGCSSPVHAGAGDPLMASGTIQTDEMRVATELGGRILNAPVAAGMAVQAGDPLVTLDATPWLLQLGQAEAALVTAQADLALVQADPRAEEVAAMRALLAAAAARRDRARAAWENALATLDTPQEIDAQVVEARTQADLAAQGVELAEAELARQELLRDQQAAGSMGREIADFQVLAAREALAAAQADEQTARSLLAHLLGIRSQPLGLIAQANAAEGAYRAAEAEVAVARAQLDDVLSGPTAEEVAVAQAAVRHAEAEVRVLQVQVDQCTIVSPIDGVVMGQVLRIGEIAAPAATILTLADLSTVTLEVYVPENRVGQVRLGQSVGVAVDSFPGRTFEGQVTTIGDQPEFTPRNVATAEERMNTFYAVRVRVPNPEGLLKPGMPADAEFDVLP
ncbi:MAG: efflux RND transporter periplasmic adaptor subunit [Anaerolineae bacterium]|nr:efflux RND transporter periplasmic adaptor subunit [Anaerolineae bacterium]